MGRLGRVGDEEVRVARGEDEAVYRGRGGWVMRGEAREACRDEGGGILSATARRGKGRGQWRSAGGL